MPFDGRFPVGHLRTGGRTPHIHAVSSWTVDATTSPPDDVFPYTTRNMDSGRFSYRVRSSTSRCQVQLEFGHVANVYASNGDEVNSCCTSLVGLWRRLCGFRTCSFPWWFVSPLLIFPNGSIRVLGGSTTMSSHWKQVHTDFTSTEDRCCRTGSNMCLSVHMVRISVASRNEFHRSSEVLKTMEVPQRSR